MGGGGGLGVGVGGGGGEGEWGGFLNNYPFLKTGHDGTGPGEAGKRGRPLGQTQREKMQRILSKDRSQRNKSTWHYYHKRTEADSEDDEEKREKMHRPSSEGRVFFR